MFLSLSLALSLVTSLVSATSAVAAPPVATLNALDKITARVSKLEAEINKPVTFGSLEITVKHCESTPPEEAPETKAFLEVRDTKVKDGNPLIFSGWMFASSPALSAVEHPVYDVWVISCTAIAPGISSGNAPISPVP